MNKYRKRIAILENELSNKKIEVFIPDRENIITDIDELLNLHHEIIKASKRNRKINHHLIDKGILNATGFNTDIYLFNLLIQLVQAGDRN